MQTFRARDGEEWRRWLAKNHRVEREVWLLFYRSGTGEPGVDFDEALDWALSFGWIDSMIRRVDDRSYARRFTPRSPDSVWSKSNIARVERLAREGRMTEHGMALFTERCGEVSLAEKFKVNKTPFPRDLLAAIKKSPEAWSRFQKFAPSHKRRYAMWVTSAKTAETRERRIREAVERVSKGAKSPK
ncbi:MAG: YdeI/OmpD-associated family protein [Thaumarchaeota archaeon]|nr:YdeI/OmpD-associated family protein [Nitrososphaerota archaeon]